MLVSLVLLFIIFPGNYCYDSGAQYHRYAVGEYSTHYPPAFCFLLGIVIDFGAKIFGNANWGIFLADLLQALIVNFALTEILFYISQKLKNKKFIIISILFLILHPLLQICTLSTCHDVVFGAVFILIALEFLKISSDEVYFTKKSNFIKMFFLVFILCIYRNNGLFALIPAVIIGLFMLKGKRIKFATLMLIPMLVFQIGYNTIFLNVIHVERQSIVHESLNIPIMQIARALYYNHPVAYSEELNTYFHEICDWKNYGRFPAISDGIKSCIDDDYMESHLFDFVKYWAKIGAKAPHRYLEAPMMSTIGLWYPFTEYPENPTSNSIMYHAYAEHDIHSYAFSYYDDGGAIEVSREGNKEINNAIKEFIHTKQSWSKVPILDQFWRGSFTTFLLFFTAIIIIYRKKRKFVLAFAILFGLWLTVFLSPVIMFRYLYPLVLATPIMFYMIVSSIKSEPKIHKVMLKLKK